MNDNRSFASLSGSLLARKGGARPAMRPRAMTSGGMLDDLGWDDMGFDIGEEPTEHVPSSIAALTPSPKLAPLVLAQQRALAAQYGEEAYQDGTAEYEPVDFAEQPEQFGPEPEAYRQDPEPQEKFGPYANDDDPTEDPEPAAVLGPQPLPQMEPQPQPVGPFAPLRVQRKPTPIAYLPNAAKRPAASVGRKAAFTLRLDGQRHLRLRLATAVTGRSAQQLVTLALDQFLQSMPEIDALADRLPAQSTPEG